ncbi:Cytochrome c-type biogenesis protein Ccl2 [Roseovarius sp. EC-HK134]|jgi:cytochrome c-type biogenesis protein CcmH|uniref:Cytochrome c-type biogenesis protein n=1 Tax=Roseovarius mucosus TaxID=215743 RepID=A0A1V0RJV5_9RHOB|nr:MULTISPECIES: cytochrome c-type biogenesis protein [Roseovarius]ARE82047.1 cytochrome c-type biogenesis protein CcmH [Roseovarius mucosus]AWZ22086.1 Cytochrome c heme lyase subunit CcmL [Roseovarius sp. AK1035]EDM29827.1 Cytochrome c maturation protein, CcmH [Roseovarius sp. TM1035]MBW4972362.1 cytochrome c-type biogenesis protein CcmH [Roseovarius mucosus]VVT26955.1 Cytochrome c-type biogenesis protein Ccl2 [Roseovarius sp. EC-HK134]|tara:strand:- start:505 stop:957 length:453 start_codon:yes stop_codon:yes gene_type:complete
MKRLILALCVIAAPVFAVQPDEILDDPALEARARDISSGLRCLVCRNESIDDSNAELARDLRLLVRERLVAGDSNDEAVDFIVARYGEYVLLKPRSGGANMLLWWAGPLMLGAGLLIGAAYLRGRARTPETEVARLSEAEENRLREILKE